MKQKQLLNIYLDWVSQPCRAVVTLCNFLNIPYKVVELRLFKGEHYKEDFKKINPSQKVPLLEEPDTGFILYESHAIMKYLCNKYSNEDQYYPKDFQIRAKIDCYLDWHHQNTRYCAKWLYGKRFNKSLNPEEKLDLTFLEKMMTNSLNYLENVWLNNNNNNIFIAGQEKISIADISAYEEIIQLEFQNYDLSKFSKLTQWKNKIGNMKEVQNSHIIFNQLVSRTRKSSL